MISRRGELVRVLASALDPPGLGFVTFRYRYRPMNVLYLPMSI